MRLRRSGEVDACECVLRAIFRVCYSHYRELIGQGRYQSQVNVSAITGASLGLPTSWGRRNEEYIADFHLVARRTLNGDSETPTEDWKIFRYRYLLGADAAFVAKRMGMDKGTVFHHIYRIEERLGRVFRDLEPYALFPLDEYFYSHVRTGPSVPAPAKPVSFRPPLVPAVA